MPFLDGVADSAPLDILFAVCKCYFFGDNGIAVLEISCKIEGGGNHPSAVLADIAVFSCFFILCPPYFGMLTVGSVSMC